MYTVFALNDNVSHLRVETLQSGGGERVLGQLVSRQPRPGGQDQPRRKRLQDTSTGLGVCRGMQYRGVPWMGGGIMLHNASKAYLPGQ